MKNEKRMTGKTTRLVDSYIQHLFVFGWVIIMDHQGDKNTHDEIFRRTINRLEMEHGQYNMVKYSINRKLRKITLI